MRINTYKPCESSFLSVDKDMELIFNKMCDNNRLKKLLYYNNKNCINEPNLTMEQTLSMFGQHIRIVPKLTIDKSVMNYIIVDFDNFTPNFNNPEFRDNIISFDIICHFDQWQLNDFQLRPIRIAAEIDSMFNGQHLSGIGTLEFLSMNKIPINDEFSGYSLMYSAIHGDEDKKNPLTPIE